MTAEQSIIDKTAQPKKRNLLSRLLRYLTRVITTLAAGAVRGIAQCVWHLAYFLLCLFRPIIYLFLPAAFVILLLSFATFVKPEASPGMPAWAMLLMAIGFGAFSIGYTVFVDWIRPSGTEDSAERFRRPDWR